MREFQGYNRTGKHLRYSVINNFYENEKPTKWVYEVGRDVKPTILENRIRIYPYNTNKTKEAFFGLTRGYTIKLCLQDSNKKECTFYVARFCIFDENLNIVCILLKQRVATDNIEKYTLNIRKDVYRSSIGNKILKDIIAEMSCYDNVSIKILDRLSFLEELNELIDVNENLIKKESFINEIKDYCRRNNIQEDIDTWLMETQIEEKDKEQNNNMQDYSNNMDS